MKWPDEVPVHGWQPVQATTQSEGGIMRIDVTQERIDLGKRGKCEYCPVALAINGVLKKGYSVLVVYLEAHIYGRDCVVEARLPGHVQKWIELFDGGWERMQPISFELPIDDYCVEPSHA